MAELEGENTAANENIEGSGDEPTTEQKLESLQTELKAEKDAREKAEKRTQGLEGSLKQKDTLLKGQATKADIEGINRQIEVMATAIAMGRTPESMEGVTEDTQKAVIKQIQEARKESEEAQKRASIDASNQKYAEEALVIWEETKGEIPETDRDAVEIYRLLKSGDKDTAEKMLNSIKANKKDPKETDKKETEEEIEERLKKKVLKELGLNKNEPINPSGGAKRKFTKDDLSKYDLRGKSFKEIKEDRDAILDQVTKK